MIRSFTLTFAVVVLAFGNDTLVTLGAGGVVPVTSIDIAMESENLEISTHEIRVNYVFRNRTQKDIDATVGFPLPQLEGGDVAYRPLRVPSMDPLNFVDFRISANGKDVRFNIEQRAFVESREITQDLQALKLPVSVLDQRLMPALTKLVDAPNGSSLVKSLPFECENLPGKGRGCLALWDNRTRFYWDQHFLANSTLHIEHKYKPIVGGSYIPNSDDGKTTVEPYCGGAEALSRIEQFKKRHPAKTPGDTVLSENRIQYILTTARNWRGPIRKFHLTVHTDSSEDILVTCMQGLKQLGRRNTG